MAADIETSLRNFRTDYIDLYQVHNPSMEQLDQVIGEGGALEALIEAKAAGKIGHIGLTAHSTAVFERALELDWVETIMFPYNIVEQQGAELIRKCAEKNIGFIDMKPLAGGAIEDGTLALRYVCSNPDVTVVFQEWQRSVNWTKIWQPALILHLLQRKNSRRWRRFARSLERFLSSLQLLCTMYRRYQYPKCISLCRLSAEI